MERLWDVLDKQVHLSSQGFNDLLPETSGTLSGLCWVQTPPGQACKEEPTQHECNAADVMLDFQPKLSTSAQVIKDKCENSLNTAGFCFHVSHSQRLQEECNILQVTI